MVADLTAQVARLTTLVEASATRGGGGGGGGGGVELAALKGTPAGGAT
jgi:hypothetical protein